jgi:hypothetical protein
MRLDDELPSEESQASKQPNPGGGARGGGRRNTKQPRQEQASKPAAAPMNNAFAQAFQKAQDKSKP